MTEPYNPESFCGECRLPVKPCGWDEDLCKNEETPAGKANMEFLRYVLSQAEILEPDYTAPAIANNDRQPPPPNAEP